MRRLPDVDIGKWSGLRKYVKQLGLIPEDEMFCAVKVSTFARLPNGFDRSGEGVMVSSIPKSTAHTTWAALERAVAQLTEEAVHYGWFFQLPMAGTWWVRSPMMQIHRQKATRDAVKELLKISNADEPLGWHDYMLDIGAKGRRREYMHMAQYPQSFVLGMRMRDKRKDRERVVSDGVVVLG